jgi:hypothetical protein
VRDEGFALPPTWPARQRKGGVRNGGPLRKPILTFGLGLILALGCEAARAAPLVCAIDQKFQCTREGCVPGATGHSFSRIDLERATYALCDSKGCEEYPATIWQGGAYINIELPGHTGFAKLSDTRNDPALVEQFQALHLLEVTSMGLVAFVSYGTCLETDQ